MLSGEGIADLCDDGLEGSINERQIFMEVFYGNEEGHRSKRCVVTSAIHFEADQRMPSNALCLSNCEYSSITSLSSMKESPQDDVGTVNQGLGSRSAKRMKSSGKRPENGEPACGLPNARMDLVPLESSSEVASNAGVSGSYHISNTITCHLVESSSAGIISSCILLKGCKNMNPTCGPDEEKASDKTKLVSSFGSGSKKVTKLKDVHSPVSQESCVSKNFSPDTVVAVEGHVSALPSVDADEELRDSDLLRAGSVNAVWKRDFIKKLRPRLREHAKHVLLSAGFEIELRKRKKTNSSMDIVYLTPSMKVIFSLPPAWKSCGEILFSGEIYSTLDDNGQQWSNIVDFWCDLSDTLAYIEKQMQEKSSISLQQRWILLDPFVTVVIIDKNIGVLTAGSPVKAIRGVSVELSKNQGMILVAGSMKGGNCGVMMDGGTNHDQGNSWCMRSINEVMVLDQEPDSPHMQMNVRLHGTPVAVGEVAEGFGDVCNHQGVNGRSFISTGEESQKNEGFQSLSTTKNSNEKLFLNEDLRYKNLKNLAMRVENDPTDASNLGSTDQNLLVSLPMTAAISTSDSAVPGDSCSKGFLGDCGLAQEPSKNQVLELPGSVSMCNTSECRTVGELMPLDSKVEIDAMVVPVTEDQTSDDMLPIEQNQFCKESVTQPQTPCVQYQEQTLNHEPGQQCKNYVHASDNSCAIDPEITMPTEIQSSACHGSSSRDVSSLVEDDKVEDCLDHSRQEEDTVLSERQIKRAGLKLSEDLEEQPTCAFTASPTGDTCAVAPGTELTMETQHKSTQASKLCSEYKKAVPCTAKMVTSQCSDYTGQDITPCNSTRKQEVCERLEYSQENAKLSVDDQQCVEVMVQQKIPFPYLCENLCNETYNLNIESVQQRPASSRVESVSAHLQHFEFQDELDFATETSKFQKGNGVSTSETEIILTKRTRKKSKKISEIKSPKSLGEHKKIDLPLREVVRQQSINLRNLGGDYDDSSHGCLKKSQKQCIANSKNEYLKASTSCSSQHQLASLTRLNKFQNLFDFLESDSTTQYHKSKMKQRRRNKLGEASFINDEQVPPCASTNHHSVKNSEPSACRKTSKARKSVFKHKNRQKKMQQCLNDDDDLLISAIIRSKNFSSKRKFIPKRSKSRSEGAKMLKSRSGSCRLLVRSPGKVRKLSVDGKWFSRARSVLAWLVDTGVVSVNDVIQYWGPKDDKAIKSGRITRDGVLCKCCHKKLSLSEFKIHAGFKLWRPCLNLFLESGQPLTLCQLQAWSSEYRARKVARMQVQTDEMDQNDDTCGRCGDGGELICCDNCPSTFHRSCLYTQELPDGDWYCPNCTCEICGDLVNEKEASSSSTAFQCSQRCTLVHGSVEEAVKRYVLKIPVTILDKVYLGLRSRMGVPNKIADGFSWMLLRCNHSDQKIYSAQRFALTAECNTKLAVALNIMEESFLPMVDPRTGIDMIPHALYNWGSDFARLNYQGFYTAVLEKGDEIVSVASIRMHGGRLAEMPLIATCSEHRRQGMCRRLMNAVEEMLKSFKVEMLVLTAIPALVETWTAGFGFELMSNKEKEQLTRINLMTFPGTTLLKKTLCHVETKEVIDGLDYESMRSNELEEVGAFDKNAAVDAGLQYSGIDLEAKPVGPVPPNHGVHPSEWNTQQKQDSCGREPIATPLEINDRDVSDAECCSVGQATVDAFDDSCAFATKKVDSERSHDKAVGGGNM
ncbi:hypothetical protein ACLOJK_011081 [Asimina triloba]